MSTIATTVADKIIARWCGAKDAEAQRPTDAEKAMLGQALVVARVIGETGTLQSLVRYCDDMYPTLTGDELKAELVAKAQAAGVSSDGTKAQLIARLEAL